MSKRKGVSAEEKRTRMLEIFYEKKEFFQLKELEKIGPKEKGVIAQSVKEVIQSLVDDGLVDSEKIGTSIYFWAFPSKAISQKKLKLSTLTTSLEESKKKLITCQENLSAEKVGREDGEERSKAMEQWEELNSSHFKLSEELKKYSHTDPEYLKNLEKENSEIKEAIDRWTDNIFAVRSWCKNNMHVDEKTFNEQFGIPEDFDYIEI